MTSEGLSVSSLTSFSNTMAEGSPTKLARSTRSSASSASSCSAGIMSLIRRTKPLPTHEPHYASGPADKHAGAKNKPRLDSAPSSSAGPAPHEENIKEPRARRTHSNRNDAGPIDKFQASEVRTPRRGIRTSAAVYSEFR